MAAMKAKRFVPLVGIVLLAVGCVKTVSDTRKHVAHPALALFNDQYEGRYERSVDQVYTAAVEVVKSNGIISRETIINPGPKEAKTIEAKVNKRDVWVRVEAVDPKITSVKVQVRTRLGGTDLDLTQELQKQIAIKLVSQ